METIKKTYEPKQENLVKLKAYIKEIKKQDGRQKTK
jgi:hypothetical protein